MSKPRQAFFNFYECEKTFLNSFEIGIVGTTVVCRSDGGWTLLKESELKRWIRKYLDSLGRQEAWRKTLADEFLDYLSAGARVMPINTPFKNT